MSETVTAPGDVDDLVFRPMQRTESDLRLFHDCFVANGSPRSLDLLRWQYFEPPAGELFIDLALTPEPARLAAIYAVFPVMMRAAGVQMLGTQSLNTLTDEAYRGKGLFIRMAKALYQRSHSHGVGLVYGFPNGNSAHGFFKRLDWKPLDPMPFLLRPLRSGYVLRKLGATSVANAIDVPLTFGRAPKLEPGFELRTLDAVDEKFDAVWQAFAQPINFAVERTAQYLQWRLKRPGGNYECVGLFRNGDPIGLVITGVMQSDDQQTVGKIMELFFDPAHERAGNILIEEAIRRLKKQRCVAVWAWNFDHSPNRSTFRHAGFISLPPNRHPTELHVGACAFSPLAGLDRREDWYVSMLDDDTG